MDGWLERLEMAVNDCKLLEKAGGLGWNDWNRQEYAGIGWNRLE